MGFIAASVTCYAAVTAVSTGLVKPELLVENASTAHPRSIT
jgi:hypothetical protein